MLDNNNKLLIGEIYRVPGTSELQSVMRYDSLLHDLSDFNGDIMIGTDCNFNLMNILHHARTQDLLDLFIASGFIPTVTIPTRITHECSSLIDNIFVKMKYPEDISSGVLTTDISDHLPLFNLIGKYQPHKHEPKNITYRKFTENTYANMKSHLENYDWLQILDGFDAD